MSADGDGAVVLPLRFQIGARSLGVVRRHLVRIALSLDEVRDGRVPMLPPLDRAADGYCVTSLPEHLRQALVFAASGMVTLVRQRYTRHHVDLTMGYDAYLRQMSRGTRSGLRRKTRKLMAASAGLLDVRRYRSPTELIDFHMLASGVSRVTYQERLLDAGLPQDPGFVSGMCAMAAADSVRAWLLFVGGRPAAYLYCPVHNATARYEHVGHNPAFAELSPGGVLQLEALRDLFADTSVDRFDFTEGDGQHKRQFANAGIACVDMLLLRPTFGNYLTVTALWTFERVAALGKRAMLGLGLRRWTMKLRR